MSRVRRDVLRRADEKRSHLAAQMSEVADEIRAVGDDGDLEAKWVGKATDRVAETVGQVADHLSERDTQELIRELEDLARRRTGMFLGAMFALGLLAGRFLRSTPREDMK